LTARGASRPSRPTADLDYRYLRLADSFHTQGFYQRESSLFHQLVQEASGPAAPEGGEPEI
jgi:hypothetical protein